MEIDPRLQVRIEVDPLSRGRRDPTAGEPLVLAVLLEPHTNPPAGQVHHGSTRWIFANRVELLEAIDAASVHAQQKDSK